MIIKVGVERARRMKSLIDESSRLLDIVSVTVLYMVSNAVDDCEIVPEQLSQIPLLLRRMEALGHEVSKAMVVYEHHEAFANEVVTPFLNGLNHRSHLFDIGAAILDAWRKFFTEECDWTP